jgi:small subunit ribosomal protein S19e
MVSIYDVHPRTLIEAMAVELKKMPEMAPPEWASFVKTGPHNMRPPSQENWWYIRSASVLRAVYKLGPIGVSKLRTKYGGRKNRGVRPDRTVKAGGNILRKILQKLEIIGFVKQDQVGVHKGRVVTPKGKSFVDKLVVKVKDPFKKVVAPKISETKVSDDAPKPKKVLDKELKIEKKEKKEIKTETKEVKVEEKISETKVSDNAQKPKKVSDKQAPVKEEKVETKDEKKPEAMEEKESTKKEEKK